MKNVENENRFLFQAETGDKEGTYEQKNIGDLGSKTVYVGNQGNTTTIVQKKVKKKQIEKVLFTE